MTAQFKLAASGPKAALVILFPPGVKGLFNAEVHGLVREVQEKLEDVYVTYALSTGGTPDLRDAFAAVRFVGCESAVVIPAAGDDAARWDFGAAPGDRPVEAVTLSSGPAAPAVVDAYVAAVVEAAKAA